MSISSFESQVAPVAATIRPAAQERRCPSMAPPRVVPYPHPQEGAMRGATTLSTRRIWSTTPRRQGSSSELTVNRFT